MPCRFTIHFVGSKLGRDIAEAGGPRSTSAGCCSVRCCQQFSLVVSAAEVDANHVDLKHEPRQRARHEEVMSRENCLCDTGIEPCVY